MHLASHPRFQAQKNRQKWFCINTMPEAGVVSQWLTIQNHLALVVVNSIWISSPSFPKKKSPPISVMSCLCLSMFDYMIMRSRLMNVDIIWILVSPPCPTEFHARLNWKSAEFTAVEADTAEFWATYQKLVSYKFRPHFKYSARTWASHNSNMRPETTNLNWIFAYFQILQNLCVFKLIFHLHECWCQRQKLNRPNGI